MPAWTPRSRSVLVGILPAGHVVLRHRRRGCAQPLGLLSSIVCSSRSWMGGRRTEKAWLGAPLERAQLVSRGALGSGLKRVRGRASRRNDALATAPVRRRATARTLTRPALLRGMRSVVAFAAVRRSRWAEPVAVTTIS